MIGGNRQSNLGIGGVLRFDLTCSPFEVDKAVIRGVDDLQIDRENGHINGNKHNAFLNQGLQASLDRMFSINGPPGAISHIGVASNFDSVTATTTTLAPNGSSNIKAISPVASRTLNTTRAGATWTQSDVNFAIRKVGLLSGSQPGNVWDIIGGTSSQVPFNQDFVIDLRNITSWSLTLNIDVTLTASGS